MIGWLVQLGWLVGRSVGWLVDWLMRRSKATRTGTHKNGAPATPGHKKSVLQEEIEQRAGVKLCAKLAAKVDVGPIVLKIRPNEIRYSGNFLRKPDA